MLTRRLLLAASAATPFAAVAQDAYPSRTIQLIIAYPPGGSTDLLGRLLMGKLAETLPGSNGAVDNRAGGGGIIGTLAAAMARPDGYTLTMGHNQTHASNQSMAINLPYHVIDSFTPIAKVATVHHALVVAETSPFRSLEDLIAKGRTERGVTYASSSVGSASHVIAETFARRSQMNATHVPYRGAAPAATDTMSGVTDFYVATWPSVVELVKAGKLRALEIGAPARLPDAPDVPTAKEAGAEFMAVDAWFGIWAPAHTPRPIAEKLSTAFVTMLGDAAIKQQLLQMGFNADPLPLDAFAAFQRAEVQRWKEMADLTGIRME